MLTKRIVGLSMLVLSSCAPEHDSPEIPSQKYVVPLFVVPAEEAHADCKNETVQCNYYSDYGTVFVFKCQNAEKLNLIYLSEKNRFNRKLWYKTRLHQDLNNQTFSEYCKSTFANYDWFMQETGY